MFGAVLFTVVAAMTHDPRWLLMLAWPFGIIAAPTVMNVN